MDYLRWFWRLLVLLRFSVVLALGGSAVLFLPQGQDVLRQMGDDRQLLHNLPFFLAAFLAGLAHWYGTRVLTYTRPRLTVAVPALVNWMPRLIGAAAPGISAAAAWTAGGRHAGLLVLPLAVAALGVLTVTWARRRMPTAARLGLAPTPALQTAGRTARRPSLTRPFVFLVTVTAAASVAATAIIWWRDGNTSEFFGVGAAEMTACAMWAVLGNFVAWLSTRLKTSLFAWLAVAAVLIGTIDGTRQVRLLPVPTVADAKRELVTDYGAWRSELDASDDCAHAPTVLVATAGGGILAAYFTGEVLGALTQVTPCFLQSVYAISSVSGGTHGAVVFDALVAKGSGRSDVLAQAEAVLGRNLLSANLNYQLYVDLPGRVLPIFGHTRAVAMEKAWERAFCAATPTICATGNPLAESFTQLWTRNTRLPRLFINSTDLLTGRRVVISPMCTPIEQMADAAQITKKGRVPPYTPAGRLECNSGRLALSTAMHLSSRFPLISPSGILNPALLDESVAATARRGADPEPAHQINLGDGGYFENSGADTLADVFAQLPVDKAHVVLIQIDTDGNEPRPPTKSPFLSWAIDPIYGLWHTRTARGEYAVGALARQQAMCGDQPCTAEQCANMERCVQYFHFSAAPVLDDSELRLEAEADLDFNRHLPLGWLLSQESQRVVRANLCRGSNRGAFRGVHAALASSTSTAPIDDFCKGRLRAPAE